MEELKNFYFLHRDNLTIRAQNILRNVELYEFENFFDYFCHYKKVLEFVKVRNCGKKTGTELNDFLETVVKKFIALQVGMIPSEDSLKNTAAYDMLPGFIEKWRTLSSQALYFLKAGQVMNPDDFIRKMIADESYYKFFENIYNATDETEVFRENVKNYFELNTEGIAINLVNKSGFLNHIEIYLKDSRFSHREQKLIRECMNIYATHQKTRRMLGNELDLSHQRVRQLCDRLWRRIRHYLQSLKNDENPLLEPYKLNKTVTLITEEKLSEIRMNCGIDFSDDFLLYCLRCSHFNNYVYFTPADHLTPAIKAIIYSSETSFDFNGLYHLLESELLISRNCERSLNYLDLMNRYAIGFENGRETNYRKALFSIFSQLEKCKIIHRKENDVYVFGVKHDLSDAVIEILRDAGVPLNFKDIYYELIARCWNPASQNMVLHLLNMHKEIFGLKGQGLYGLIEWGGYYGTINDVAEQILKDHGKGMHFKDLKAILMKELIVSEESIRVLLFSYKRETRFIITGDFIDLKERTNTSST